MLSSGSSWVWGPSWGQKPEIGAENPRQVFGRNSLTKAPWKDLLGFGGPAKGRSPSLGPKTQEESQEEPEEEPHKRSFKASPRGSSWVWGPTWGRNPEIGVENPRRVSIRTSEKFLFLYIKKFKNSDLTKMEAPLKIKLKSSMNWTLVCGLKGKFCPSWLQSQWSNQPLKPSNFEFALKIEKPKLMLGFWMKCFVFVFCDLLKSCCCSSFVSF